MYSHFSDKNIIPSSVLLEWESVLGKEYVVTKGSGVLEAEATTFATNQRVPAILYPATREQVQQCLRIAGRYQVPVYPVSTGKNWGYGSRVPVESDCVLLDLHRMNRIVDYSENLAYVTVEPGVTQGQLFCFLAARKSQLWMDATGSSPDCSLIGNTLERGFGHTPYGDHISNVCRFEVVLATGELLETGFGRYTNAQAASVYPWGSGPSLDGLFAQSNFGVVTRMTFWLMPAPERFEAFFFRSHKDESLPILVDALQPLRLNGTLRGAIHLGNDYKVISAIRQYPWEETNGLTPLSPDLLRKFRKEMNFGAWNGSGGLYGTRAQVAEARRLVQVALRGKVDKLQFLSNRLFRLASRFSRPIGIVTGWDLSKTLALVKPLYGLMQGVPTDQSLASVYWRKRNPPPKEMDPDKDLCGLLWCSPVAPAEGRHARIIESLAAGILPRHGFEPMLSITMITGRALMCVISISYDREVQGEDQKARACFDELRSELAVKGYPPYRLGIQSMGQIPGGGAYGELLAAIKSSVDPAGILAPGRYASATLGVRPNEQVKSRSV